MRLSALLFHALLVLPAAAAAAVPATWSDTCGEYAVRSSCDPASSRGALQIVRGDAEILRLEGGCFEKALLRVDDAVIPYPAGMPATGRGVAEAAYTESGEDGGATLHLLELGESPRETAMVEVAAGAVLEDLDGDGALEVVTEDPAFAAGDDGTLQEAALVVLHWRNGRYLPDAELMREDPPDEEELAQQAKTVREDPSWDQGVAPAELERQVLEYLYTGHPGEAWDFLDQAWPEDVDGVDDFVAEMKENLACSPYWSDIARAWSTAAGDPIGELLETVRPDTAED